MKVDRKELVDALEKIMPGVGNVAYMANGNMARFSADGLYSFNNKIAAKSKSPLPEPMELAVDAVELLTVLKRSTVAVVDLDAKNEKLVVKLGNAKATLATSAIFKNSPLYFDYPTFVDLPADYYDAFKVCMLPGNKHQYAGVYLGGSDAWGTDAKRIVHMRLSVDTMPFWLNDTCVKVLLKYGNTFQTYAVTASHVWFRTDDFCIVFPKLNAEVYPMASLEKYNAQCGEDAVDTFNIPEGLYDAVQRAAPFTEVVQSLQPVHLTFMPSGVFVQVSQNGSSYEEMVDFDEVLDIPENTLIVDHVHLLHGLRHCNRMGVAALGTNRMLVLYSDTTKIMMATMKEY